MNNDQELVRKLGTVGDAFFGRFPELLDVQRRSILAIYSGRDVLVASATASGKTEAVVAPLISRLLAQQLRFSRPRIRLLVVAPTRALVNDLARRIGDPLSQLGLSCDRQTSDRSGKGMSPFCLVTTPESLDSMLVRDGETDGGGTVDHLLGCVDAVFIDEAHLFDGTVRGDQMSWLLGRLRRVRQVNQRPELQVCGGSATVGDPQALAGRLCGRKAEAVVVLGTREIEVRTAPDSAALLLSAALTTEELRGKVPLVPLELSGELHNARSELLCEGLTDLIWNVMWPDKNVRKVLVFVPTRSLADLLSEHLRGELRLRRDVEVLAHHGSLARELRETSERTFGSTSDAVLVATTTLEVGIDIGDIDLVVLVGAPPNVNSLLQRIGRGGRKVGRTVVLPIARDGMEQAALASMLRAARKGTIEPPGYGRRWSVFVQQAASFVRQAPRGRRRRDLLELSEAVWPDGGGIAKVVVEHLVEEDRLIENRGRLFLGDEWADVFSFGLGMHSNIDAVSNNVPVVNASTGEIITYVARRPAEGDTVALGGQRWQVEEVSGEVRLKATTKEGARAGRLRYASRGGPVALEYAAHVRQGLLLEREDAPHVDMEDGPVWLHFGGSAYQTLLCHLLPDLRPMAALAGIAVAGRTHESVLGDLSQREDRLVDSIESLAEGLERVLSVGPYHGHLPPDVRRRVVREILDVDAFKVWLQTRRIWDMNRGDRRWTYATDAISGQLKSNLRRFSEGAPR